MPPPAFDNSALSLGLREFKLFRSLVDERTGIWLRDGKQVMLASRLSRRLRHHGIASFADYYEYVQRVGNNGDELREPINCVTTNKHRSSASAITSTSWPIRWCVGLSLKPAAALPGASGFGAPSVPPARSPTQLPSRFWRHCRHRQVPRQRLLRQRESVSRNLRPRLARGRLRLSGPTSTRTSWNGGTSRLFRGLPGNDCAAFTAKVFSARHRRYGGQG